MSKIELKPRQAGCKGQSAVEALVALALLTTTVLGGIQIVSSSHSLAALNRMLDIRDRLAINTSRAAGTSSAIMNSSRNAVSENSMLRNCVVGSGGNTGCVDPGPDTANWHPMRLYSATYREGSFAGGPITGLPSAPLRYNARGYTCDVGSSSNLGESFLCDEKAYPVQVFTRFRPICNPPRIPAAGMVAIHPTYLKPTATCRTARLINIEIVIQPSNPAIHPFTEYRTIVPINTYKINVGPWWN